MKWDEMISQANTHAGYGVPEGEFGNEFDKLVFETFSSPSGLALLKFLETNLLLKSIWDPNNSEINCYFMEGRNNLVRLFIERKLAYTKKGG